MIYIFIVPVILMSVGMLYRLQRLTKHDKVLYKFCQLRRDTIQVLREKSFNLTKEEFFSIRELLFTLDEAIHNYDRLKIEIFTLGEFVGEHFRKVKATVTKTKDTVTVGVVSAQFELPKNTKIRELYQAYFAAMFFAFFVYTPFIRFTIVLNGLKTLTKIIGHFFENFRKYHTNIAWLKEESQKFGVI